MTKGPFIRTATELTPVVLPLTGVTVVFLGASAILKPTGGI